MSNEPYFVNVRGIEEPGETSQITLGFVRRYKLRSESWRMSMAGAAKVGNFDWTLGPFESDGTDAYERKLAWNTLELMRASPASPSEVSGHWALGESVASIHGKEVGEIDTGYGIPLASGKMSDKISSKTGKYKKTYPLWWDMQGTDPNFGGSFGDPWGGGGSPGLGEGEHRSIKQIGGMAAAAARTSAEELRGILDYKLSPSESIYSSHSAPEELWQDFIMRGVVEELAKDPTKLGAIGPSSVVGDMLNYQDESKVATEDDIVQLVNKLGLDFAGYTQSEMTEHQLVTMILDSGFAKSGGWHKGNSASEAFSVGRETTSEVASKIFGRGLTERGLTEANIGREFFKNTEKHIKDMEEEISKTQHDLISKIHNMPSVDKAADKFEDKVYAAKQTADRAIKIGIASYFGPEGLSKQGLAYDYYLPIPPKKGKGDISPGTWLGNIRIKPVVHVETVSETPTLKGISATLIEIEFDTRVYETGKGTGPNSPATVIQAVLKILNESRLLEDRQVREILSDARGVYEKHALALHGKSLSGALYNQTLQDGAISEAMGGGLAQIKVVNIASGEEIAKGLKKQIKDSLGGKYPSEKMKKFFNNQSKQTNAITKQWEREMSGVLDARDEWAKAAETQGFNNAKRLKQQGHPFSKPAMTSNWAGSLVGAPYFISKGAFTSDKVKGAIKGFGAKAVTGMDIATKAKSLKRSLWAGLAAGTAIPEEGYRIAAGAETIDPHTHMRQLSWRTSERGQEYRLMGKRS